MTRADVVTIAVALVVLGAMLVGAYRGRQRSRRLVSPRLGSLGLERAPAAGTRERQAWCAARRRCVRCLQPLEEGTAHLCGGSETP